MEGERIGSERLLVKWTEMFSVLLDILSQFENFEAKMVCFEHPLRRNHQHKSFSCVVHKASVLIIRIL